MDLTGYPTDFLADLGFPEAARRFLVRRTRRWPRLSLNGTPLDDAAPASWQLPEEPGASGSHILGFARDAAMEQHWEDEGYALDGTREGPFALFYSRHGGPLTARAVTGVSGVPEPVAESVESIGLMLTGFFVVTLLTPDDPATDPFSGTVLNDLRASFSS
ncbi:hypothetical protein GCM10010400_29920 [Streptomyces aculeolatus]|uniref:hypothetical protein n=1 Tax=Streptomyces aculeolatus TaxID=270689 RepID=UPI001CED079F|nr:hypothetical protein [Streptomyces aculeolatus]